jgi:hypothetical protein
MSASNAIVDFWRLFSERRGALAQINTADDPVYDELLEQLQHISPGLFFEFSAEPDNCELIITAEGDRSLFALVDSIVLAAPQDTGWKFCALKPKLGFPESVEWEGFRVNIADVRFDPLSDDGSDELGLRLLVPGLSDDEAENAHNALLRAIDHGLGESKFAGAVHYTEVAALDGHADDYIPLLDLESFIQWRRNHR